jgi:uncharacterized delta-60 repeat protein
MARFGIGILLGLSACVAACGAIEGLGGPPDVNATDAGPVANGPDGALDVGSPSGLDAGVDTGPGQSGGDGSSSDVAAADSDPPPIDAGGDTLVAQDSGPPTSLDETFGGTGVVTVVGGGAIGGLALAVEPSGSIVFTGTDKIGELVVGRLTSDGGLDTSFASTGILRTYQPGYAEVGASLALVPGGGMAITGFAWANGTNHFMFVAKLTESGDPYPGFGGGSGFVPILDNNIDSKANTIVAQPDGKLLVGGFQNVPGSSTAMVRLNADGTPDTLFDPPPMGTATIGIDTFSAGTSVNQLTLLPTGDIRATVLSTDFKVLAVTPSGKADPNYGWNGSSDEMVPGGLMVGDAVMGLQSDGSAVCIASTGSTIELLRFGPDGFIDKNFGQAGRASVHSAAVPMAIAVLPDDSLAVAVELIQVPLTQFGLARFTKDGLLDTTFADAGFSLLSADVDDSMSIAVDGMGRIVIGIGQVNYSTDNSMVFARFLP